MQQMDPLLHTDQSQTAVSVRLFDIEAAPAVAYLKLYLVRCLSQSHLELGRSTIFHRIMQPFLGNPEKTQRDILGQMRWDVFVFELHADFVLFGEFPAKAPDAGRDAQIIQLRGMQLMRQRLEITRDLGAMLMNFLQPLIRGLG